MDFSDDKEYFEWKVHTHWLKKWKHAEYAQEFFGPKFNAIGAEWQLRIYPNGYRSKGHAALYIYCTDIKSDETKIYFSHFIHIESIKHYQTHLNGSSIKKGSWVQCNSPFKFDDIQNESKMSIYVKIWKKGSIGTNESQLVSNIYLEKMKKLQDECSEAIGNAYDEN
eukprot:795708_1